MSHGSVAILASVGLMAVSTAAYATPVGIAAPAAIGAATLLADDLEAHPETSAEIIVTAPYARDRQSALSAVTVLQGAALTREIRTTIGETLSRQAGVSSTSFGPNASRPILRGFQGERIRVLSDGIGSFDVSNTSVDHAVIVNPQLAERIEVLHGPASLLYGSSAVGGVVNNIDKRIPRSVPEETVHLDVLGSLGSAASERNIGAVVDVPLTSKLVAHIDGSFVKTGDLRIADFVLSKPARVTALASGDAGAIAAAGLRDRLPNSASQTWQVAGGLAVIDSRGELGFAVSHYDSLYGVPGRYDLSNGDTEAVRLDVRQTRVDARAGLNLGGALFERLSGRFGFADYKHQEIDAAGVVGTTFLNKSLEGRIELAQADRGGWKGASGVQYLARNFDVIGDEAFIPRNTSSQFGLFSQQEAAFGAFKIEAAARFEHAAVQSHVADFRGLAVDYDRSFNLYSGSIGASLQIASGWHFGVNLSRTERAPGAEELLANGPHAGTQAFEIGDPLATKERSYGAELTLRGKGRGFSIEASGFYNRINNFVYETQTGAVIDALPVFQTAQADARYYGFEVQGEVTLAEIGAYTLKVDALADYVSARLVTGGPLPRIPPLRMLAGAGLSGERLDGRVEIEWGRGQSRTASFETATAAYTLVNASVNFRPFADNQRTTIILSVNNLLNDDARRHASFLKDFAPLAGRDVRLSVRFTL